MAGPRAPLHPAGVSSKELQIGPMPADQTMDADDVDLRGDVAAAATTGSAPDVLNLMELNAAHYADLTPQLVKRRDPVRSETLDLEEVIRIASPSDGDIPEDHASVRGEGKERVVTYIVVHESGRIRKGWFPYERATLSQQRYDEELERRAGARVASRAAGATEEETEEDPRVAAQAELIDRLQEQVAELQDPEPYEGFKEDNVDEVVAHVRGVEDFVQREALKARILDYEARHKNRSGVKDACEPEDPPAPPEQPQGG